MKTNASTWLFYIALAAIGVLFIVYYQEANILSWLVRAIGAILLVPGIITLLTSLRTLQNREAKGEDIVARHSRGSAKAILVVSVADILVALWMLIAPAFFANLMVYLLAAGLIVYGVCVLAALVYANETIKVSWIYYIVPSLSILAGLAIIITPIHETQANVTLLTGIILLVMALNSAIQSINYSLDLKHAALPADHRIEEHTSEAHSPEEPTASTAEEAPADPAE